MKKRMIAIVMIGVMILSLSGCIDKLSQSVQMLVYNETQDSTYTVITIRDVLFEVESADLNNTGNVQISFNESSPNVFQITDNSDWMIYCESLNSSVYDTDDEVLASNIEYAYGSSLDVDEKNKVSASDGTYSKVIFGGIYNGAPAKIAYLVGNSMEAILIVSSNTQFSADKMEYIAKSLEYSGSTSYSAATYVEATSEEPSESYSSEEYVSEENGYEDDYSDFSTMTIGNDLVGYIDIPDSFDLYTEEQGVSDTMLQYVGPNMADYYTLDVMDSSMGDARDYAENAYGVMLDECGEENVESASVTLGGYDAYQVYCYYVDEGIWWVVWFFDKPEDGSVHYLSIEGVADDYYISEQSITYYLP